MKRECQVVLLLFNLRLSYKEELKSSNNHKPFSGHWQHHWIGNKGSPAAGVPVNPLTLPEQHHIPFTACSSWPQVHPLGFGLTLTF